jgi:hypothetical protein
MDAQLTAISQLASQRDKVVQYQSVLTTLLTASPHKLDALVHFLDHILQESVGLVVSRQILSEFLGVTSTPENEENGPQDGRKRSDLDLRDRAGNINVELIENVEVRKGLLKSLVDKLSSRAVSFEEQVSLEQKNALICVRYRRAEDSLT